MGPYEQSLSHINERQANLLHCESGGPSGACACPEKGWWTGLDSNQRTGNPGRFTVCCL
jgi:hypothetical protein